MDFHAYQELKIAIHRYLLNKVDLEKIATDPDDRTRTEVFAVIEDVVAQVKAPFGDAEKKTSGG